MEVFLGRVTVEYSCFLWRKCNWEGGGYIAWASASASSQPNINATDKSCERPQAVILHENSFLNVRFHTTVATASTVDNELTLTGVADRSFVNRKFLYSPGSRHDCIDSNFQGINMQINFVLVGYCASNILWLDLLKPVKFNYLHLRENSRVGRPRWI